jgi:ubiquinone/menaquinone biosynthesis C-methylase UbiE
MSSLALMRLLESAPLRYDAGVRLLTLGRIAAVYQALAEAAGAWPGARVLEIGCGTGGATKALVARGAQVTALDQNPEMLEQARRNCAGAGGGSINFVERTASEIDAFAEASFDAVVASLSLSEMSRGERSFVLAQAFRVLRPNGVIAVADETRPPSAVWRVLHAALRAPQALLAWLIVGSVSRPIPDLAAEIASAGFIIRNERRWLLGSLVMVIGERPA